MFPTDTARDTSETPPSRSYPSGTFDLNEDIRCRHRPAFRGLASHAPHVKTLQRPNLQTPEEKNIAIKSKIHTETKNREREEVSRRKVSSVSLRLQVLPDGRSNDDSDGGGREGHGNFGRRCRVIVAWEPNSLRAAKRVRAATRSALLLHSPPPCQVQEDDGRRVVSFSKMEPPPSATTGATKRS